MQNKNSELFKKIERISEWVTFKIRTVSWSIKFKFDFAHIKLLFQLRDEFDSGKDVVLDETQNPHEVGALLKEYFRDLPEPLLTRDLYSPFVATRSKLSEIVLYIK